MIAFNSGVFSGNGGAHTRGTRCFSVRILDRLSVATSMLLAMSAFEDERLS